MKKAEEILSKHVIGGVHSVRASIIEAMEEYLLHYTAPAGGVKHSLVKRWMQDKNEEIRVLRHKLGKDKFIPPVVTKLPEADLVTPDIEHFRQFFDKVYNSKASHFTKENAWLCIQQALSEYLHAEKNRLTEKG